MKSDLLIIGGGIWGNAIAYYYAVAHPGKKVQVIEQNELNNGATSRAAALLTKVRTNPQLMELAKETSRVIPELEIVLQDKLGIKKVGLAHVATDTDSFESLKRLYQIAETNQEPFQQLNKEQVAAQMPFLHLEDIVEIGYFPDEAYCDPYLLGSFFARAAQTMGVSFKVGCKVTELVVVNNRISGVKTNQGEFSAEQIVLAAGVWSNVLLDPLGLSIPYAPVRSQFWITEPIPDLDENAPIVVIPSASAYMRPEGNCLLFGIREQQSMTITAEELPFQMNDFRYSVDKGFSELAEVIHLLEPYFPTIYDVGIKSYMAGFSGYAPDSMITIGKCTEIDNLFIAGGDCGAGIALAGGVGKYMLALLSERNDNPPMGAFSPDRFGKISSSSIDWLKQCAAARSKKKSG